MEEGEWVLYLASKEVDELGIAAAYRKVHPLMRDLGQLWVDRFEDRDAVGEFAGGLEFHRRTDVAPLARRS